MQPQPSWESHHTAANSSNPSHYPAPASQGGGYENYDPSAAPYSRSTGNYDSQYDSRYGRQWHQGFPESDYGSVEPLVQEPMGSYAQEQQWGTQGQGTWYGQYDRSCETNLQRSYGGSGTLDPELSAGSDPSQFKDQQFQTEYSIPIPSTCSIEAPTSSSHSDINVDQNPLGCHGSEGLDHSYSRSEYENSFLAKTQRFVMRNTEVFNTLTRESAKLERVLTLHEAKGEESFKYAEPDALEYHMQVSSELRRKRVFELVKVGDIVRGHVTAKRTGGLSARITSFVRSHKFRELSDLDIEGLIPFENLSDSYDNQTQLMNDTELDDVIQGVVDGVFRKEEMVVLSFQKEMLPPEAGGVSLGYMEGKRPQNPTTGPSSRDDFLRDLEEDPGFSNPSCVENLKGLLGITGSTIRPTLLPDIQLAEYPDSEFSDALRKAQRGKWSMESVAVGVKYFKAGEHSSALKHLNHALEIDPENVEGLVARGALSANTSKYKEAISDFEAALRIKHTHSNARKYLVETQVAYGKQLERRGKLEAATRCYREALADDPQEETARVRLEIIVTAMKKQAAEQREEQRRKEEEEATLKKLHKIIKKQQKKNTKKSKHKKKKKAKSSKKKKKKTVKDERYSSDESTATADSYDSDETRSPSPDDGPRGKGCKKRRSRSERSVSVSESLSSSPISSHGRPRGGRKKTVYKSRSRSRSQTSHRRKKTASTRVRSESRSRSRSQTPHRREKTVSKSLDSKSRLRSSSRTSLRSQSRSRSRDYSRTPLSRTRSRSPGKSYHSASKKYRI